MAVYRVKKLGIKELLDKTLGTYFVSVQYVLEKVRFTCLLLRCNLIAQYNKLGEG